MERTRRSRLGRIRAFKCEWAGITRRVREMSWVGVHGGVIEREVGLLEGGAEGGGGR